MTQETERWARHSPPAVRHWALGRAPMKLGRKGEGALGARARSPWAGHGLSQEGGGIPRGTAGAPWGRPGYTAPGASAGRWARAPNYSDGGHGHRRLSLEPGRGRTTTQSWAPWLHAVTSHGQLAEGTAVPPPAAYQNTTGREHNSTQASRRFRQRASGLGTHSGGTAPGAARERERCDVDRRSHRW